MRVLICAALLLAGTSASFACDRYIHETDPETWIKVNGDTFIWHKANDGEYVFETGRFSSEGDPRKIAYSGPNDISEAEGDDSYATYRFANVNGKDTLIWESWFYFSACQTVASAD